MKVVGRQARWQNPLSPPSSGNAVCSWLNGVGEICTHFHPFGKFLSNGKTEKLLHGKTSHHLHEFTNCHASAFYSQHRVKKYMQPWSMVLSCALLHTFSLPPSSHQPVSPHFVVHGRKASPDRPDLPPSLSPLFVILFLYLERQPPPSPSRARSVCPSVDLGAHSLHHSFTSTRETIHRERERGLEAACSVLRPPLILACIIKQVPQSQTAARCTLHCR